MIDEKNYTLSRTHKERKSYKWKIKRSGSGRCFNLISRLFAFNLIGSRSRVFYLPRTYVYNFGSAPSPTAHHVHARGYTLSLSPSFKDSVPSIRRTFTENIFPRTPLRTCSNREWRIFGFSELDARETRGGRRGGNNCREIFQRGERPPPPTSRSAIFPFVLVPVSVSRGVPSVASPMTLIIGRAPRSIKRFRATWSPSGLGIGAVSKPPELLQLTLDLYWDRLSVTRVSFFPGFFPPFVRRSVGKVVRGEEREKFRREEGKCSTDLSLPAKCQSFLPSWRASGKRAFSRNLAEITR